MDYTPLKRYGSLWERNTIECQQRESWIYNAVQGMSKGKKSMTEYLGDVKGVCDQLDSIDCALSEQEMIYGALAGLGKEYESICTVIEHSMNSVNEMSFEDVVFKLITFDDKVKVLNNQPEPSPHLAFHAGRGYSSLGRGGNSNRGGATEDVATTPLMVEASVNSSLDLLEQDQPVRYVVVMVTPSLAVTIGLIRTMTVQIQFTMLLQQCGCLIKNDSQVLSGIQIQLHQLTSPTIQISSPPLLPTLVMIKLSSVMETSSLSLMLGP